MYTENVAFPPEIRQRVAGEFGDPFSAGQVGLWPGGRVYSTGFGIPRIKDRFTWSVAPMYAAPSTGEVRHGWNDQPHIVTIAAERLGNLEQTVQLVTYLAGPEYQARVGIDRGHFPVYKDVADLPESLAAPPEGMEWLKTYATTPQPRTPGYFPYWDEFIGAYRTEASKLWVNEVGPEEAGRKMAADTTPSSARTTTGRRFRPSPRPFLKRPAAPAAGRLAFPGPHPSYSRQEACPRRHFGIPSRDPSAPSPLTPHPSSLTSCTFSELGLTKVTVNRPGQTDRLLVVRDRK